MFLNSLIEGTRVEVNILWRIKVGYSNYLVFIYFIYKAVNLLEWFPRAFDSSHYLFAHVLL